MENNKSRTWIIIPIVLGILTIFCCCCIIIGIGVYRWIPQVLGTETPVTTLPNITLTPRTDWLATAQSALPTLPPATNQSAEPLLLTNKGVLDRAEQTLKTLQEAIIPSNDPIDLANRLGGKLNVPNQLIDTNAPYAIGAQKKFWVSNVDTNKNFKIDATLRYVGENIYFWIQDGVKYKEIDLKNVASLFDKKYIPTNRAFFGSEWNPGVDGDPRIYVLYAGGLGYNLAGYFSSADELHPDAHPYSNAHEMFLINSDNVGLGEDYLRGTMAHEFQHMIHWYQDKNEETWMNEGFSMLAEHVNKLDAGGFDYEFASEPDLQLTDWGEDVGLNGPHYGSAYLFMVYFLDRFGEDATKALVAEKENGLTSVTKVMNDLNILNPSTNAPYTGVEVFRDWTDANILQDPTVEGGRYDYKSYNPPSFTSQNAIDACPQQFNASVSQFGTQYIDLGCANIQSLSFTGPSLVKLLPLPEIPSGEYFLWSNAADESNSRLTRTFDLSQASGKISMDFKVWYELEKDYDFAFVSASTDGKTWKILNTRTCTTDNISGNSYGCGWNGNSNTWIDESVDLSEFAGKQVTVRFDYVTDAAVNLNGLAIDDLRLAAIGYSTDFETNEGGWQAEGFARVTNYLPQEFILSVIYEGANAQVEQFSINPDDKLSIPLNTGTGSDKIIIAVSGTTPVTREKAEFSIGFK
jgi:immune inhibitor A